MNYKNKIKILQYSTLKNLQNPKSKILTKIIVKFPQTIWRFYSIIIGVGWHYENKRHILRYRQLHNYRRLWIKICGFYYHRTRYKEFSFVAQLIFGRDNRCVKLLHVKSLCLFHFVIEVSSFERLYRFFL